MSFRWELGDWVGGSKAINPSYKTYLALRPPSEDGWAVGEFEVQPRDTSDIVVSGLGFRPTVLMLVSFRPRYANDVSDGAFGDRGGGMTFGVAGYGTTGPAWDSSTTYSIGDVVLHEGVVYAATAGSTNSEPPSANWAAAGIEQFSGSSRIRHAFETAWSMWREDVCFAVAHKVLDVPVLEFDLQSFDSGGFTLNVPTNLYDEGDYVAWLAVGGTFQVGVFDTGDTSVGDFGGTPTGAVFLSVKHLAGQTARHGYWDHMQGFASRDPQGQSCIWGGSQPTAWGWSTERWHDDEAILLCTPASGSSFAGASVDALGLVTDWVSGGIELQWPIFSNKAYRIGYILTGEVAEASWLETNYEKRPGGTQTAGGGSDYNVEPTLINPHVIIMSGTNYTFGGITATDPFLFPRNPDVFQFGGGAGLGWHAAPFSRLGYDAFGVHTYDNSVQERGHYQNSGAQYTRRWIMAGNGPNSNPPAYHQHSVNVIPNPVIVGTNWRYADRHAHMSGTRALINPDDDGL